MKNSVKKAAAYTVTAFAAVIFLVKSDSAAAGVLSSMKLCAFAVVPSLFPFFVLSSYAVFSGAASATGRFFEPLCRKIFRLPGEAACIILMSLTGGFPVGAKMISASVQNGTLSRNQGRRMMLFCVNAGPAFIISTVGQLMLGSKKAGVILLASTMISSLAAGILTRFFEKEQPSHKMLSVGEPKSTALIKSVEGSMGTVVILCGWIFVFGAVRQIISDAPVSDNVKLWSDMLCEVTNGCRTACVKFPLPVTAFVLGFSGFAVHAQIMPFLEAVGLRYRLFFVSRLINGACAAAISEVLFRLFPCEVQVFASSAEIVPVSFSVSAYASAAAIITAALIILDLAPAKKV